MNNNPIMNKGIGSVYIFGVKSTYDMVCHVWLFNCVHWRVYLRTAPRNEISARKLQTNSQS